MTIKQIVRSYGLLVLLASLVIILDQVSKAYIRANFIEEVDMWAPWAWMLPYARIINVSNTGVAFGMFKGIGGVFTILAIIVAMGIVYYFPRVPAQEWLLRVAMGLMLGGALGNLIDRLIQGHVTDFLSFGNFPVFNVADMSITGGVAVLALGVWKMEQDQKKELAAQTAQSDHAAQTEETGSALKTETPPQDGQSS